MLSSVSGRLIIPHPSHDRSVPNNEDRQPEAIIPKCEPQTSEPCSPEVKSISHSLSCSNGPWFIPNTLTRPSLVLQNSGNLARDQLSIERTWLSYMRTGLSITWTGVGTSLSLAPSAIYVQPQTWFLADSAMTMTAVAQCFAVITADPHNSLKTEGSRFIGLNATSVRFARPLGATLVVLSLCVIAIGLRRYFKVQKAILQGSFPATQIMVVLLSAALATLMVVTLGVLLTPS